VSDGLQPDPVTVTVVPVGPTVCESEIIDGVTVKVSHTEPWTTIAFVSVTVYIT
jgi:hypothetical protein